MNTTTYTEERFDTRHIGPSIEEEREMLQTLGVQSIDDLIDNTIPASIRRKNELNLPKRLSEYEYLQVIGEKASKNQVFASHIGMGYYGTIVPSVIQRNILENPGWYTQYTPYQAEISQGRLEALLNFQTMIMDLTGMEIANASLLDEGTAAAEAMIMMYNTTQRKSSKKDSHKLFVAETCYPQTIEVIKTRAKHLGIEVVLGNPETAQLDADYFGIIIQYPDEFGAVKDYSALVAQIHELDGLATFAADIMSLALLTPPGEFDADIVVGNTQRFGVPMGFGGPHAAYFATREKFLRQIPGRIIGVSVDSHGNNALRMALQTREQHIRREKATSNICTAQALLAIMAGMYGVFHGPQGVRRIASNIHILTKTLASSLTGLGYVQENGLFFDTLKIAVTDAQKIRGLAEAKKRNFRYIGDSHIGISLDETCKPDDVHEIASIFAEAAGKEYTPAAIAQGVEFPEPFARTSEYMTHAIFNQNHSETEILRYIKHLENKDLSLTHSMIPLGSCTMKLNATTELMPISWKEFANIHPFVPREQAAGYLEIFEEFESYMNEITGFAATSLQPNSGAQGEYAGLLVIRAYQEANGEGHRDVALIPESAHGTNPASAVMAGCKVVIVKCDENGNIDLTDLRAKADQYKETLSCLMVTYPSTHGVFEEEIIEICQAVHDNGGQVYMDGANMNAQVGFTSPAIIGADVCHLNLHKTFSIPHGGGGPGMGPICVAGHLAPYLPGHSVFTTGGEKAMPAVSATPFGSSSITLISYGYVRMLGKQGCEDATRFAILNANYLRKRLEGEYDVLYMGKNGTVAHEFILDLRDFKHDHGIEVEDIAKRLIDYGFHAPTVSFPVAGTLMVEPTESESKAELDRFAEAMLGIRAEIQQVIDGTADAENNVLKNAPHTAEDVARDEWTHPYTRETAAYPAPYLRHRKFWVSVGRVNNSYGDRNVVCACPPIEDYMEEALA